MRSFAVVIALGLLTGTAAAEQRRPDLLMVPHERSGDQNVGMVVNSKTIFLNRCAGGCKLTNGFTDSRTNKSQIGSGTLTAFQFGDTSWNAVMSCMKATFSKFNVDITDTDPGATKDHFEIMVAGAPTQIGLPNNVGGIAEYSCQQPGVCDAYLPDTIVFAFANTYAGYPNRDLEICATAAQEIAHTWSLDHVQDPSDPLTYNTFSGMRQFHDGMTCGSDCVSNQSPFGLPCTAGQYPGGKHTCMSTGGATQDEVQILLKLFGPAGAKAPTLKLNNPTNGSAQPEGFTIAVDCTSGDGIQEVQYTIDGVLKSTQTAAPFSYLTPSTLTKGSHHIGVLCATKLQAISTATADVIIGDACETDAMCTAGSICYGSACIAGPDAPGGLGATCTSNTDCVNGACGSDGNMSACTIPCDLDADDCPEGFGCLDAGNGGGVCWAGVGGGGCCDTSGHPNGAGAMLLGLGLAAAFVTCGRRRNRR